MSAQPRAMPAGFFSMSLLLYHGSAKKARRFFAGHGNQFFKKVPLEKGDVPQGQGDNPSGTTCHLPFQGRHLSKLISVFAGACRQKKTPRDALTECLVWFKENHPAVLQRIKPSYNSKVGIFPSVSRSLRPLRSLPQAGGLQSTAGVRFPLKECWIIKTAMSRTGQ